VLEDTLIYYVIGDNGASAEGTTNGSFNEYIMANGMAAMETPEFLMERLDRWARRSPTRTTRSAGRTRWTRRTNGPSRSPRTSAGGATAPSCVSGV
jgi:hypothetical protein